MQYRNTRALAIGGVLGSAVLAIALVMPAARLLGTDHGLWQGVALFALPILALLTATGIPHYGVLRGVSVAAGLTVLVSLTTWLLAIFAVASALSGPSSGGLVLTVAALALPALVVLVPGLLATRLLNGPAAVEDREPSPPLTPSGSRIPHR